MEFLPTLFLKLGGKIQNLKKNKQKILIGLIGVFCRNCRKQRKLISTIMKRWLFFNNYMLFVLFQCFVKNLCFSIILGVVEEHTPKVEGRYLEIFQKMFDQSSSKRSHFLVLIMFNIAVEKVQWFSVCNLLKSDGKVRLRVKSSISMPILTSRKFLPTYIHTSNDEMPQLNPLNNWVTQLQTF